MVFVGGSPWAGAMTDRSRRLRAQTPQHDFGKSPLEGGERWREWDYAKRCSQYFGRLNSGGGASAARPGGCYGDRKGRSPRRGRGPKARGRPRHAGPHRDHPWRSRPRRGSLGRCCRKGLEPGSPRIGQHSGSGCAGKNDRTRAPGTEHRCSLRGGSARGRNEAKRRNGVIRASIAAA